jgi:hypothetical protein
LLPNFEAVFSIVEYEMKSKIISTYNFGILDEIITQQGIRPLSLNPNRNLITSFREIGDLIAENTCDLNVIDCMSQTLEKIIRSQLINFPENIFWDFDLMVSSLLEQALIAEDGPIVFLESFGRKIELLMDMFGCRGGIRFRYVHDFMYGFDWARWVKKDPNNRSKRKPFSPIFLDYLLAKGQEILSSISIDDKRYHHISSRSFRNAFCFPREPKDEYRLLTYLADYGLIPVNAWNWNAEPIWNKPFDEIREQVCLKNRNL